MTDDATTASDFTDVRERQPNAAEISSAFLRHYSRDPREALKVFSGAALDAAREQGAEEERERWRERVEAEAKRLDRWAQEGSVDQFADRSAAAAILRSLLSAPAL